MLIDYQGYRIVADGELFRAPAVGKLVTLMRKAVRFREPDPSNETFMDAVAGRCRMLHEAGVGGAALIRTNSAKNFINDLAEAEVVQLIKREHVWL